MFPEPEGTRLTKSERVHPIFKGSPWRANDHSCPVLQVDVILIFKPPAGEVDDDEGEDDKDKPDGAVPHALLASLKFLKQPKAAGHHWGGLGYTGGLPSAVTVHIYQPKK